jgi:16S rRNA (cytosine1402-N4)-methyltransferase
MSVSPAHDPIMVSEVLAHLRPAPGEIGVDCTLGGGGHARAILPRLQPGGRLIGIDRDPIELPRTEARLRAEGWEPPAFTARHADFADLPRVLAESGYARAHVILADLGVTSMQFDDPARGFSYKRPGPLDMRMNPLEGEPASSLIARLTPDEIAALLRDNADETHAELIARLLKQAPGATTDGVERTVRLGLAAALAHLTRAEIKASIRRTFQALRIAVNDEFGALDALLRALPACLAAGGRVAIVTFHSGEDRRVKQAFRAGRRGGIYDNIATAVVRPSMAETRRNRRVSSGKLRWAIRSQARAAPSSDGGRR